MTIDVGDLVESVRAEVNPPGADLFPNSTDSEWELRLSNAFWELRIAGLITGFTESEGLITELAATPINDLGREYQQLIVIAAALNAVTLKLIDINTLFRAEAGPVEYEVQKSASVLTAVLERLQKKYDDIVDDLPDAQSTGNDAYFNVAYERSQGYYPSSTFIGY